MILALLCSLLLPLAYASNSASIYSLKDLPEAFLKCDSDEIRMYGWTKKSFEPNVLDQALEHCAALGKAKAVHSIIMISSNRHLAFKAAVKKVGDMGNTPILEYLLDTFSYELDSSHLSVKSRNAFKLLLNQSANRFYADLDRSLSVAIKRCTKSGQYELLKSFLSTAKRPTSSVYRSLETAIINRNFDLIEAILGSGRITHLDYWQKVEPDHVKKRIFVREKMFKEAAIGKISDKIKFIEPVFLTEFAKFISSQNSSAYIKFMETALPLISKSQKLEICEHVFKRSFDINGIPTWNMMKNKINRYPFLAKAIQLSGNTAERSNKIIDTFKKNGYQLNEQDISFLNSLLVTCPSCLVKTIQLFSADISFEDLSVIVQAAVSVHAIAVIQAVVDELKDAGRYSKYRFKAYQVLFEDARVQTRASLASNSTLLLGILQVVDPQLHQRLSITNNSAEVLQRTLRSVQTRIQECRSALATLRSSIDSKKPILKTSVNAFIRNGGSWDEILLLAVEADQEDIVEESLHNGADCFACFDISSDIMNVAKSEKIRRLVISRRVKEVMENEALAIFMKVSRSYNSEDFSSIPYGMRDPSEKILNLYYKSQFSLRCNRNPRFKVNASE